MDTTTIPYAVNNYYSRMLLERAVPLLTHDKWGQIQDIPTNGTNIIKFRKYGALAPATTPLTEGVTPAGSSLSVTDITATVSQYGDYVTITDFLKLTTLDPILMESAKVLGEQAGATLDIITRNIINAGTNVQFADTGGAGVNAARGDIAAADKMETTELAFAIRTMAANNAKKVTEMVRGDVGYATSPVDACYVAIVHPYTSYTLQGLTGFIRIEKYANKTDVMKGEIGAWRDIRFVETTYAKVFTGEGVGGIDVYSMLVIGKNAYGISRISGAAMENIIKPLGSAGTADPLNQRATSGWKATKTAIILQQLFMMRIEHAVA